MDLWKRLNSALTKVLEAVLVVFMIALVIVVFFNSVGRYTLGKSIPWGDEGARFLFIWITFIGAVLAFQTDSHMKFRLVINSLPKRISLVVAIFGNLITIGLLLVLLAGGSSLVALNMDWLTPALEIPYGAVYTIVPIGFGLIILLIFSTFIENLKKLIKGDYLC